MLTFSFIKLMFFIFRNFQSFENTPNTAPVAPMPYANVPPPQYGGSFFDPTTAMPPANVYGQPNVAEQKAYTGNEYEDEPPLLEGKY